MLAECGTELRVQIQLFLDTYMYHKFIGANQLFFYEEPHSIFFHSKFSSFLALGSTRPYLIFFVHEWNKRFIRFQGLCFIDLLFFIWKGQAINDITYSSLFFCLFLPWELSAHNWISKGSIKTEFCLHPNWYFSETTQWD